VMTEQERNEIAALAKIYVAKEATYFACSGTQNSEQTEAALHIAQVEMDIAWHILNMRKRAIVLANSY
jgi:hypothetical protein